MCSSRPPHTPTGRQAYAELVLIAAVGFLLASLLCMGSAKASAKRHAVAVATE
jgi:hypothetical protein